MGERAEMAPYDPRLDDPEWLASRAILGLPHFRGEPGVPCRTWTKDFRGQTTNGRIGRPIVSIVPLSWLGSRTGDAVRAILRSRERGDG